MMLSPTQSVKLLLVLPSLCLIQHFCNATDCASSCGNITISYPFRLITDPPHCGHKHYELACQDNVIIVNFNLGWTEKVVGYPVRAINYNNFTIRVVNPYIQMDNCGLPTITSPQTYCLPEYDPWYSGAFSWSLVTYELTFMSCPYPVNGSFHVYNSPCNLKRYWYFYFTDELENGCRIEAMSLISLVLGGAINLSYIDVINSDGAINLSYIDVINSLAYGFELSWDQACCYSETSKIHNCSGVDLSCYNNAGYWKNYNKIRNSMTNGFDRFFAFFHKIRNKSVFSVIFVSLNYTLGGHVYDKYEDLTVFGLVIHFLLAILICSKLLSWFLGPICVTIFLMYKWRRRHLSAYDNVEEFLQSCQNYLMPVRYSYSEIKKITRGFKEKLGEGGYGFVYKGKLRSGSFAAIKMLNKSKANGQDFINEVATIGRIHHVNVVRLIGFCVEGSKRALVYEFMSKGSLDKYIFSKGHCIPMSNKMIFDVCLGVAHGIEYLHQGCDMQILHFDIKPHNILLDENFSPKISDFGLAKLHSTDNSIVSLTAARGTIGYIAPEFFYKNIGGISYKADVYSFGMLLMEMIGRRKNINAFTEHSSRIYFPSRIYDQFAEGKDIKLGVNTENECNIVKKMIIVALWCIQLKPINRPSMRKVIEMLEGKVEHLKMPPKPFIAPQQTPTNDAGLHGNSEISSTKASNNYADIIGLLIN